MYSKVMILFLFTKELFVKTRSSLIRVQITSSINIFRCCCYLFMLLYVYTFGMGYYNVILMITGGTCMITCYAHWAM